MTVTEFSQTDILNIMNAIFKAAEIRPLRSFFYQLPEDIKTLGVIVVWISKDKEEFWRVREAANKAGLWFAFTKYGEKMSIGVEVSVFVIQDRRDKKRE